MFGLFLNSRAMRLRRVRQRVRTFVDLAGDKGELGSVSGKWAMATLTYAEVGGWRVGHIQKYLKSLRQWASRRGFRLVYVWVAELQLRGAVHYHILLKLPKGVTIPKPDRSGMWSWGSSRVEWVRKSGKRYLSKYTSKGSDCGERMPRGLRICGAGGLPVEARAWWSWLLSPRYVRHETEPCDYPRRVSGGWVSARGFLPSPWVATPMPELGGVYLSRKGSDSWRDCAEEPFPSKLYLLRASVRRVVAGWVETMWRHEGGRWRSPWSECVEVL